MNKFLNIKLASARLITLGEFYRITDRPLPKDKDANEHGYALTFDDSSISWAPLKSFDIPESSIIGTFGYAIEALKNGQEVQREGWIDKLVMVPGRVVGHTGISSHIDLITDVGDIQPGWIPNQEDMFADDWQIVE